MLRQSFIHIPGVGHKTERRLWRQGIRSWQHVRRNAKGLGQGGPGVERIRQFISESEAQYRARNIPYFLKSLPPSETWRLYPDFRGEVVFLDIETTGLSTSYDEITVVGLYDLRQTQFFIRGQDLDGVPAALERYKIVVTFNGSLFDLPFLRAGFPGIKLPPAHIDLRFLLRRLGLTGGLKEIERQLGIGRSRSLEGVNGYEATILWNRYLRGSRAALRLLLEYNQADILNLKTLLDYAYTRLSGKLLGSCPARLPSGPRAMSKWLRSVRLPEPSQEMTSQGRRALDALLERLSGPEKYPVVVGIDLTGSAKRPSGWASLMGREVEVKLLSSDADLIRETLARRPDLVSIDSPLSIPNGRHCTSDRCWCRPKYGIARHCERELWRRGVRVYPCLLPSMQKLTMRGIRLAKEFRSRGIQVIESYPGAAQDILRIPRKKTSLQELLEGIRDLGLKGDFLGARTNHDEMDAITSALVGYFFLAGSYEAVGIPEEDYLIIPKKPAEAFS
jgi:uncharacterized protein YprB with RNaseH-like and TPR domain/predicted nuclease with RNAse H fold